MALPPNSCPSGYSWYTCARPSFTGCCSVDACSNAGCPPGSEYSPDSPPQSSRQGSTSSSTRLVRPGTGSPSASVRRSSASPTAPPTTTLPPPPPSTGEPDRPVLETSPSLRTYTGASSAFETTSARQTTTASGLPSDARSGGNFGDDTNPIPLAIIVGAAIGGALIILIVILALILCRRYRKSKNSTGGLLGHGRVPKPLPGVGAVVKQRIGFLALFKRTHPVPADKTAIVQTSSPSTTCTELPSPSVPQSSQRNSILPGFAELASPPMSSVSELSSGDREVYSSTNVSTASTGAVLSPLPRETLRGGDRPIMRPNMASNMREGRGHALSWQNLGPGDGC